MLVVAEAVKLGMGEWEDKMVRDTGVPVYFRVQHFFCPPLMTGQGDNKKKKKKNEKKKKKKKKKKKYSEDGKKKRGKKSSGM